MVEGTSTKTSNNKEDFDYFFELLKRWKMIFLVGILFAILGGGALFLMGNGHQSTASFAISLPKKVATPYGNYYLKIVDPQYYLNKLTSQSFKNEVKTALKLPSEYSINVSTSGTKQVVEGNVVYPKQYEITIGGVDKKYLNEINDQSIALFLKQMDNEICNDIEKQFKAELSENIKNLTFKIENQHYVIDSLTTLAAGTVSNNTSILNDERKHYKGVNLISPSDQTTITAILLAGKEGINQYMSARIILEKSTLVEMNSKLKEEKRLLKELSKEGNISNSIISKVFSRHFFLLVPSEVSNLYSINGIVEKSIIFFILGSIIASAVLLVKTYYAGKW